MDASETVTLWLKRLKQGDQEAANALWQRYFERVTALARIRLGTRHRKASDEEDVALSVFDTLCRGVRAGKYPRLTDRDSLWPLLVVLTIRRVCDRVQREDRQKRGGGLVQAEAEIGAAADEPFRLDELLSHEPTPETAAIMDEECSRLFARLDEDLRPVALGKLQGYTNQELAAQMNCGLRTIERRLDLIRRLWEPADDSRRTP